MEDAFLFRQLLFISTILCFPEDHSIYYALLTVLLLIAKLPIAFELYGTREYYLETDPDPIVMMVNRVELFTHKPSETTTNLHCMVTHARLCYRCLLSAGLVDE